MFLGICLNCSEKDKSNQCLLMPLQHNKFLILKLILQAQDTDTMRGFFQKILVDGTLEYSATCAQVVINYFGVLTEDLQLY